MPQQPQQPTVSILIPNYNNGAQSSQSGSHDHIAILLQSLYETLADDPTPFEIIALDDGSTDDSLPTLRDWAERTWPNGSPFLQLIEAEHCGVLAKTANTLSLAAKGRILVRLDGDVQLLTPNWVTILTNYFDNAPPQLGVVGPKQLRPDLKIHAYGDWVIHPNGYHHVAVEADRHAVRHPIEVDHVMGCFYCCKKQVFDELEGYDESILRGQTVDFGLRARLAGYRAFAIPHIEYIHAHGLRKIRTTKADTIEGVKQTLETFTNKWGFNRIAPDLAAVRKRYKGTPLLWHPRWSDPTRHERPTPQSIPAEATDWARYQSHEQFRASVDHTIALITQVAQQLQINGPIAQIDCGQGLLVHLLAQHGYESIGTDTRQAFLNIANENAAVNNYAAHPPRFEIQKDLTALPLYEKSVELILLIHIAQHHPNPVGLFNEAKRVLKPGGAALIVAQRRNALDINPLDFTHPYRLNELTNQAATVGFEVLLDPAQDDPTKDIILPVRKPGTLTRLPTTNINKQPALAR